MCVCVCVWCVCVCVCVCVLQRVKGSNVSSCHVAASVNGRTSNVRVQRTDRVVLIIIRVSDYLFS